VSDEDVDDFMTSCDMDCDRMLVVDEFATLATNLKVPVGMQARSRYVLYVATLLAVVYTLLFTVVCMHVLDLGFVDASYWAVSTLSTVGSSKISAGMPSWLAVPIFLGLCVIALLVNAVAERVWIGDDEGDDGLVAPPRTAERKARPGDIEDGRAGTRTGPSGDLAASPAEDSGEIFRVQ
jgi:hypothetical protein